MGTYKETVLWVFMDGSGSYFEEISGFERPKEGKLERLKVKRAYCLYPEYNIFN